MKRRDFSRRLLLGGAATELAPASALACPTRKQRVDAHNRELIAGLFPKERAAYPFEGIVVHPTATAGTSVEGIGRYHAKRFGDPPGWIHIGRWQHEVPAIHLFKPELAVESVAICLVGNFEEARVHGWQLDALVSRSRALADHLDIDLARVRTHRGVDGILTQRPGKRFPPKRYLARLSAPETAP